MKPEISEHLKSLAPSLVKILKTVSAMKGRKLAELLKISERELRLVVAFCRENVTGRVISGDYGYKYSLNNEEVNNNYNRIEQHSYSQLHVVKSARRLLAEEMV